MTEEVQKNYEEGMKERRGRMAEKNIHGEWDKEVDRFEWAEGDFIGLALRNQMMGWCGYVGIRPSHPLFGKDYNEIEADLRVHGGISYSEGCAGVICHVPPPGTPDNLWWLGFDCGHSGDLMPGMLEVEQLVPGLGKLGDIWPVKRAYRNLDFVKREIKGLMRQLGKIKR